MKLIYAYGQTDDITYHSTRRGTKELNLLKYMPRVNPPNSNFFDITMVNVRKILLCYFAVLFLTFIWYLTMGTPQAWPIAEAPMTPRLPITADQSLQRSGSPASLYINRSYLLSRHSRSLPPVEDFRKLSSADFGNYCSTVYQQSRKVTSQMHFFP